MHKVEDLLKSASVEGYITSVEVNGNEYRIFLPDFETDYIQRKIAGGKAPYEQEMLEDLARHLVPGNLVLDIGANIGNHSLYLAAIAGCDVVSFEPNLQLAEALRYSAQLNGLEDRLSVHAVGLGAESGKAVFRESIEENLGAQSLLVGEGEIEIRTLDEFAFDKPVSAIKIDVEGMEYPVLQGGRQLIERDRPILYVECAGISEFRKISQFMAEAGYSYWDTFNATPTHLFMPSEKVSVEARLARMQYKEVISEYQLKGELALTRKQLDEANNKYKSACNNIDALKENLENRTRERDATQASLATANEKYRATGEQITSLKQDVNRLAEARQQLSSRIQSLQLELAEAGSKLKALAASSEGERLEARKQMNRLTEQKRLLEKEKSNLEATRSKLAEEKRNIESQLAKEQAARYAAEQRLIKLRGSLTYQLGYQIKNALQSPRNLVHLPVALYRLLKQRKVRKARAAHHTTAATAAPAITPACPVASYVPPAALASRNAVEQLLMRNEPSSEGCRIACIMDDFTFASYTPECELQPLTPANWHRELEDFQPTLLFVESAWRGHQGLWGSKVGHNSDELKGIIAWCKERSIPTVFWNKEDPVHFQTFLGSAKQFDYVFTTDIDRIRQYKEQLGHQRVFFLPFACQPSLHNPLEFYQRKDAISFAGAYYVKYPDRTRDLDNFIQTLPGFRPVEIFDRNFGGTDQNYMFPAAYAPFIVGTLPFERIDEAYKGYRYSINLNSIKQSQSMFARRVYELLGSNTVVISNYSPGIRLMFGDLVVTSDCGDELLNRLQKLAGNDELHGRFRLAGLRKTMMEHTYGQRMSYVLSKVLDRPSENRLPSIAVLAYAEDQDAASRILQNFTRQRLNTARLCLIIPDQLELAEAGLHITLIKASAAADSSMQTLAGEAELLACMHPDDFYAENYLLDLALATRYANADAFGKSTHYTAREGQISLQQQDTPYTAVGQLPLRSAAIRISHVQASNALDWVKEARTASITTGRLLAIDPYNYCRDGASLDTGALHEKLGDLDIHCGLSIDELLNCAENIQPGEMTSASAPEISARQLEEIFAGARGKKSSFRLQDGLLHVESQLADGKHEYVYAEDELLPDAIGGTGSIKLHLDKSPGLNLQLTLVFLDEYKQKISHVILAGAKNHTIDVPVETAWVRIGWRVYSSGVTEVSGILLGHKDLLPGAVLGRSDTLLITNNYPSYADIYRNGFVHSRMKSYLARGRAVDVFRFKEGESIAFHEYEGVDVVTGSDKVLAQALSSGRYKTVLVHFLDEPMWRVIKPYADALQVVIWVHGAEIQPWWRRAFMYRTDSELQLAKSKTEQRLQFWRSLIGEDAPNIRFVFVSHYFADQVMEDLKLQIPKQRYRVIHNPINTELFSYEEKPESQRMRVLSIRPYASTVYANDLSVKAIEELSSRPWFKDVEFRMIGEGPLFDEILEPLRKYPNVKIEKRFLRHSEIAALHKTHGIFLCPSRMDTQGVSRDEAMSSGLVPVTSAVAAIPEFTDASCAILAPEEDHMALAQGIAELIEDPERFAQMSQAAALKVRQLSDMELITEQEIALMQH